MTDRDSPYHRITIRVHTNSQWARLRPQPHSLAMRMEPTNNSAQYQVYETRLKTTKRWGPVPSHSLTVSVSLYGYSAARILIPDITFGLWATFQRRIAPEAEARSSATDKGRRTKTPPAASTSLKGRKSSLKSRQHHPNFSPPFFFLCRSQQKKLPALLSTDCFERKSSQDQLSSCHR